MSLYLEQLRKIKLGIAPKTTGAKNPVPVKKISDKKAAEIKESAKQRAEGNNEKERWFKERRKEMIGVCQCGCARNSSKRDDNNFRSSIAHILPQRLFKSVQFHPLNWVERNFWDGCHTNMDNGSIEKWVNMADWEDIKEKFFELSPLLTDHERASKFYSHLERLVYSN